MNPDLDYLCKRTKLSLGQLLSLLDDDDYNLLVDSLATDSLMDCVIDDAISFPLFCKLTVFHKTKNKNFSLYEKAYVADSISIYFPKLHNKSHYLIDHQKITDNTVRFYLVLLGMFPEYVHEKANRNGAPDLDFYLKNMKNNMIKFNHTALAKHSDYWIKTLHEIKNDEWF